MIQTKQIIMVSLIYFFTITLLTSCTGGYKNDVNPGFIAEGFEIPYKFNNPSLTMKLERELTEISGLTYSTANDMLVSINDEDGSIFMLDPMSGAILDQFEFAKDDDYEGVATHNGIIYVVESNGNIKVVNEKSKKKVAEYDDKLSRKNDVEGICYDPQSNTLLLAAKGDSREDGNKKDEKAIFSMDIGTGVIAKDPIYTMNIYDDLKKLEANYISKNTITNLSINSRIKKFGPSGIAIQPRTGNIYLLSSLGKTLVILAPNGETKAAIFLKNSLHIQPEGITFDPEGNLYISNEGRSGKGVVYKYYQEKVQTEKQMRDAKNVKDTIE